MEKLYVVICTDDWTLMYDNYEDTLMFYDDACELVCKLISENSSRAFRVARLDFNVVY